MSVTIVLEMQTTEDKVDDVIAFLRSVLPDTRSYEGFESLTVHRDQDDPTKFLIFERWATRPNYEAYLAWRGEKGKPPNWVP